MDASFLPEPDWRDLLREIHDHQVIPIVGPEFVTLPSADGPIPLYKSLAPALASSLKISGSPQDSLNAVACRYMLAGGKRQAIYREVAELLDGMDLTPPPALRDLASITDFDLFISGTIDPLLAVALEQSRPGFQRSQHVLGYDYKRPVDVPETIGPALVYHLLGNRATYPNFAVWEEDYLEFLNGLMRHHAQLDRLFLLLKTRYLLLLGSPFTDWLVRLFLFIVKGGRFSDQRKDHIQTYLTDHEDNLGQPLIFFFDQVVGTTRVIKGDPAIVAAELARRWRAEFQEGSGGDDVFAQMPEEIPRGAVFLSYSREDLEAVKKLAHGLRLARVPVWVDRQRLQAGDNYERNVEFAVKNGCSFFLSVISRTTEGDPTRFAHLERRWAAQRHVEGFVFYIPVIIDDTVQPALEPAEFAKVLFERLPGGAVTPSFTLRLRKLVDEYRLAGQPRS